MKDTGCKTFILDELDLEEKLIERHENEDLKEIKTTKNKIGIIILLAVASFCSTTALSCIAPFYPIEAKSRGMSITKIGFIFGVFDIIVLFAAPLFGKHMSFFGVKKLFVFGLLICGMSACSFGILQYVVSSSSFFWISLIIRCSIAIGDAAFVTSSYTIGANYFKEKMNTIIGMIETFAGLGYTAGPFIGSVLYEFGGFKLPFFVLGAVLTFTSLFAQIVMTETSENSSESKSGMKKLIVLPEIKLMVLATIVCSISLSFFDPTFAHHLSSFNLSSMKIGFMFLLCGGFFTIAALLWGYLIDKFDCGYLLTFFGASLTAIAMVMSGPSPLFGNLLDHSLTPIAISRAILGISASSLYIPTFKNCLDIAKKNGFEDSPSTYGPISGILQAAFAFGAFIGPIFGSISVDYVGFPWTATIISAFNLIFIICQIFTIHSNIFTSKANFQNKRYQLLTQES